MNYVLSIIRPREGSAGYGKATVSAPKPSRSDLFSLTYWELRKYPGTVDSNIANGYAEHVLASPLGTEWVETDSGVRFRTDAEEDAPHPCPCCGRLVLVTDHPHAHDEDAVCTGCYTWDSSTPCLAMKTAHPEDVDYSAPEAG